MATDDDTPHSNDAPATTTPAGPKDSPRTSKTSKLDALFADVEAECCARFQAITGKPWEKTKRVLDILLECQQEEKTDDAAAAVLAKKLFDVLEEINRPGPGRYFRAWAKKHILARLSKEEERVIEGFAYAPPRVPDSRTGNRSLLVELLDHGEELGELSNIGLGRYLTNREIAIISILFGNRPSPTVPVSELTVEAVLEAEENTIKVTRQRHGISPYARKRFGDLRERIGLELGARAKQEYAEVVDTFADAFEELVEEQQKSKGTGEQP